MTDESLRAFRRNVVHIRQALALSSAEPGRICVDGGSLQDRDVMERRKRLSIPVRRALRANDLVSFERAFGGLRAAGGKETLAEVGREWHQLQEDLDSTVGLGGSRVARRQILTRWLEGAAFYDPLERDRAYDRLLDEWGTAAESIGVQFAEEAARVILMLDALAADALGEPVILPPPPKTPPPPPDPKESLWQRARAILKRGD